MLRSDFSLALALGIPAMAAAPAFAHADQLPRPTVDYAATARASGSTQMKLAHGGGRLRVEVGSSGTSGAMTGLIDPKRKRMIMLTSLPGMDRVALEMELPEGFAFADLPPEGSRFGEDSVAGEACELWRTAEKVGSDPVEACITSDGIVMRAKAAVNGKPQVVFEVTELVRGPQDPAQFEVPKGVKVTKVPRGMQGIIPGLGR